MSSYSRAALSLVVGPTRGDKSDAELALGLGAGEDWALAEAWHRFAPMVLVTAERALGSSAEAEDLTQEVFCRVFRLAKTLREPERLRSFVYSVAVRALKSQLRHRRLRAWLSFHAPETLVDLRHATLDVEARDLLQRFYTLLDRLSPRDRLVFVLRRVESMTVEEIASTMDISTSTVKRSMTRASTRLSRWVEADPNLRSFVGAKSAWRSG
jgi:RNA polymerase sigma-70 factor (ECF subfamily)